MQKFTLDTNLTEFLTAINDKLKGLSGVKYDYTKRSDEKIRVVDLVHACIADMIPEELELNHGYRIVFAQGAYEHFPISLFEYKLEEKADKRYRFDTKGSIVSVRFEPVTAFENPKHDHFNRRKYPIDPPAEETTLRNWLVRVMNKAFISQRNQYAEGKKQAEKSVRDYQRWIDETDQQMLDFRKQYERQPDSKIENEAN